MQAEPSRWLLREPGLQVTRLKRQPKAVPTAVDEPASRRAADARPGGSRLFSPARERLSDRRNGQSGTGTATETHAALRGAWTLEHRNPRRRPNGAEATQRRNRPLGNSQFGRSRALRSIGATTRPLSQTSTSPSSLVLARIQLTPAAGTDEPRQQREHAVQPAPGLRNGRRLFHEGGPSGAFRTIRLCRRTSLRVVVSRGFCCRRT
jgi:hypothetical protein